MSRSATASRPPWEDRWSEPSVRQLLSPVPPQHRRPLEAIIAELDGYDGIAQQIVWYGPGWNWTIQYQFDTTPACCPDVLCYLVPRQESPIVCVPLREQEIDRLPIKRLNRLIREGILRAKCAVTVNWATITPNSRAEAEQLIDLIRRKHKAATTKPRAKSGSTKGPR